MYVCIKPSVSIQRILYTNDIVYTLQTVPGSLLLVRVLGVLYYAMFNNKTQSTINFSANA